MLDSLSASGGTGLLLALGGIAVLAILVLVLRRNRRRGHHALVAGHRLAVIDQIPVDETRRLVLIQRDDVQHLVILGGGSDFLVESGIGAARAHEAPHNRPVALPPEEEEAPLAARPDAAHPAAAPAPEARPVLAPAAREPEPVRPMAPAPSAKAPAAPSPFPPRQPGGLEPARPRLATPVRPEPAASPGRTGTAERPESGPRVAVKLDPHFAGMVEQLEETLRRPAAASLRSAQASAATDAPAAPRAAPEVQPVAAPAESPAPAPEILPPAADEPAAAEARPPDVLAPTAEDRLAPADPFEQEMASLLGRTKRP